MANVTRKDVVTKALGLDGVWTDEEVEVLRKILKSLDRKSTGKPSKAVIANIGVKNEILALIADGRARTAREIAEVLGVSTNKVANLVGAIVKDGKAVKVNGEKAKDAPKYVGAEDAEPYAEPKGEDA